MSAVAICVFVVCFGLIFVGWGMIVQAATKKEAQILRQRRNDQWA